MKILVFGITENPGGIESVIMNYYRKIDREKYHFDFLCNTETVAYEDELKRLGGTVYRIPARSKDFKAYRKAMDSFFSSHAKEYDAIWVNICSLANIDYLICAKKYGIPKRIIHSHNSQNMDSRLRGLLHQFNKLRIDRFATDFWTCSDESAEWFYRKKLMPEVVSIHNAIDISQFAYSGESREKIRRSIGVSDAYVIGNVGRLHFQKNQGFLIDIFNAVHTMDQSTYLVLVGQGPDLQKLQEQVHAYGLDDSVLFAGVQSNVPEWLSAFDCFLFPSLFEGVSLVGLEAQANGLPVLASDGVIPQELKVNENMQFYSLEHTAEEWARKVLEIKENSGRIDAAHIEESMQKRGYDIRSEVQRLEKLFSEGRG